MYKTQRKNKYQDLFIELYVHNNYVKYGIIPVGSLVGIYLLSHVAKITTASIRNFKELVDVING